jgi:hypothetical protein
MVNDLKHGDSNGTLDLDEFKAFCIEELKLRMGEKEVRMAFHYLDADRSGCIDVEEIVDEVMVLAAESRAPTPMLAGSNRSGNRSGSKGFSPQLSARPSTTPRSFKQNMPDMKKTKSGVMEKKVLLKLELKVVPSGKRQFCDRTHPADSRTAPWQRKTIADVAVTPREVREAPSNTTGSAQSMEVYSQQRRALPTAGKLLTAEASASFLKQGSLGEAHAEVEVHRGHSWFHRQIF